VAKVSQGRYEPAPFLSSLYRHQPVSRHLEFRPIEARRAAVQLSRALKQPTYEREPPQRALKRELAARRIDNRYEAQIRSEQLKEGKFRQPLRSVPQFDERNPPPSDDIREFLDRRRT
jgi:hypothetical protein